MTHRTEILHTYVIADTDGSVPLRSWRFGHPKGTRLAAEIAMLGAAIQVPEIRQRLRCVRYQLPVAKGAPAKVLQSWTLPIEGLRSPGIRKILDQKLIEFEEADSEAYQARATSRSFEMNEPPPVDASGG